jgi:amino acid transporter
MRTWTGLGLRVTHVVAIGTCGLFGTVAVVGLLTGLWWTASWLGALAALASSYIAAYAAAELHRRRSSDSHGPLDPLGPEVGRDPIP